MCLKLEPPLDSGMETKTTLSSVFDRFAKMLCGKTLLVHSRSKQTISIEIALP